MTDFVGVCACWYVTLIQSCYLYVLSMRVIHPPGPAQPVFGRLLVFETIVSSMHVIRSPGPPQPLSAPPRVRLRPLPAPRGGRRGHDGDGQGGVAARNGAGLLPASAATH